jgi:hypothetical protein
MAEAAALAAEEREHWWSQLSDLKGAEEESEAVSEGIFFQCTGLHHDDAEWWCFQVVRWNVAN